MVNFPLALLFITIAHDSPLCTIQFNYVRLPTAFAPLSKRNIKDIQAALVYVIEWQVGKFSSASISNSTSQSQPSKDEDPLQNEDDLNKLAVPSIFIFKPILQTQIKTKIKR